MPTAVTDPVQLQEWTQEVLETRDSLLFAQLYNPKGNSDRDAAWETADPIVQKVEALIRGYARLVPGTTWNRWIKHGNATAAAASLSEVVDPTTAMNAQHALLLKIHNEGYAYMQVRHMQMEETHGPKPPPDPKARQPWEKPPKQMPGDGICFPLDARKYTTDSMLDQYYEHHPEEERLKSDDDEDEDDDDPDVHQDRLADQELQQLLQSTSDEHLHSEWLRMQDDDSSYVHDFALPGPTVNMYDTILDTLACAAPQSTDPIQDMATATNVYDMVILRHFLDGGDYAATANVHTRPTILTFNAQIRLAAQLPWHDGDSIEHRDDAITMAVAAFFRTHECGVVERNSATHTYLIQCMQKYMPPSRIRGYMAMSVVQSARYHGILSPTVIETFKQCSIPSNCREHDELILKQFTGDNYMAKLPFKWFRLSKKRQYAKREEVY